MPNDTRKKTAKSTPRGAKPASHMIASGDLGALLAAVLAHPDTPTELYNAVGDVLCSMSSAIDFHTPEMIARTLEAAARREAERKGGAR